MGLIKKDGHLIKGVLIQPAYAKVIAISYNEEMGEAPAFAMFGISTTRENLNNGLILSTESINFTIDKKADHIFEDAYTQAKETIFQDWEDDIVTSETEEE
jgi:hypothetical protein